MAGAAIDGNYAKRDGDKPVSRIRLQHGDLTVIGKPQCVPGLSPQPTPQYRVRHRNLLCGTVHIRQIQRQ